MIEQTDFSPLSIDLGRELTESSFAGLEKRWIDRELAVAAGFREVDSREGAQLLNRTGSGRYEGLAIPYFLPGETRPREWRLRRKHPDVEMHAGKLREVGKYLSPAGRGNMIYFIPGADQSLLHEIELSLIITEGEFKTLALWRLAKYQQDRPRFVPVGLPGVWNWKGTVGKTPGPNGDRTDVKGEIADLDRIAWEGRKVIIAFDADAEAKGQVEAAKFQLTRALRARGALVTTLEWDMAWNGTWLAAKGSTIFSLTPGRRKFWR